MPHKSRLATISFFFILNSCASLPVSSSEVSKIDQPKYLEELKRQRPDLLKADCKANLIAKPEYRSLILTGSAISSLIKLNYSKQMQSDDLNWANEFRELQQSSSTNVGYTLAAYYDPADYVGFLVGNNKPIKNKNLLTHPFIDSRGFGFKVFFQFKSVVRDLRVNEFRAFAKALADENFSGDLKVQLSLGTARFKFNNIVVHAASKEDGLIAERVGLKVFSEKLAAISRGVDVDTDKGGKTPALDWSEFLCTIGFESLPKDVQDYVDYR
jgi:hypothetical protein